MQFGATYWISVDCIHHLIWIFLYTICSVKQYNLPEVPPIMKWTVLTLVMLITTSFAIGEEAGTNTASGDPHESNEFLANYVQIEKTLHTCAVPSDNMFKRLIGQDGQQQSSAFDMFCYYEASRNPLSLFLCQYYKSLVETHYRQYCDDPDRQSMDMATQYTQMLQTPSAPCKTLVVTVMQEVQPGVNKPAFSSTDDCETVCQHSLFCTNLAYLLSSTQITGPFDWEDGDKRGSNISGDYTTVGNTRPDRPFCADIELICEGESSTAVATYGPFYCNDAEQGSILAECFPESGSQFRCGDTEVSCTCTDHGGLQSECGFMVHVKVDRSWNPCWHLSCENGGTCVESYTSYNEPRDAYCLCRSGYKGEHCENVDRTWNPCLHLSCHNGGTCRETETSYNEPRVAYCSCPEWFEGKYCDYDSGMAAEGKSFHPVEEGFDDEDQGWTYQRETGEPGSYFFVFLVVSIVLIIFMYIVYHNKTKIKNYFGDLQAERQARKNTRNVNYNVYIRLEERT